MCLPLRLTTTRCGSAKPGCWQICVSRLDTLIVYADKEHGGNFEYLTGFIPVSKKLLVLHRDGEAVLVLGNENLKLAGHARLENRVIHAPWFSLPNQPMDTRKTWLSCSRRPALPRKTYRPGGLEALYRRGG
jgi:hypothetical protein